MPSEYPYVLTIDKFREFLARLADMGVPSKVDIKFLRSLGYSSSNDRNFGHALRFLGLIDSSGIPTPEYRASLRGGAKGRGVLARLIREAYADLFAVYPDAHRRDSEALQNFFKAHTDLGGRALQAMAGTFQALCAQADFSAEGVEAAGTPERDISSPRTSSQKERISSEVPSQAMTINVNIQLELPATTDGTVYDALFRSMGEHILRLTKV